MNKLPLLLSALVLVNTYPSTANAAATFQFGCDYSDSALYGGYGWHPTLRESCDPVINEELGTAVELTPVVWDGNADIANRSIQCDLYQYDAVQQKYQRDTTDARRSYRLKHLSLSPTAPFNGWKTYTATNNSNYNLAYEFSEWSIENGVYTGGGPLDSPVFELVTTADGSKAVRRWVSDRFTAWYTFGREGQVQLNNPGFYECRDLSGADFAPTGIAGNPTTAPVTLSNLEFSVSPNPDAAQPGALVNKETGQAVNLVKAHWNYNTDIAGKTVGCESGSFATYNSTYQLNGSKSITHPYHYTDSENRIHYRLNPGNEGLDPIVGSYEISNNTLQFTQVNNVQPWRYSFVVNPIFSSEYVELVGNGIRVWHDADNFEQCYNIQPTGNAPTANNSCDYSNAELYNGWGWNPATRQSCAPSSSECIDSDGDGWGWNGTSSCQVTTISTECIDTDGDGWGWNGTSSCEVSTVINECIDTDGDGWGWDGSGSCRTP